MANLSLPDAIRLARHLSPAATLRVGVFVPNWHTCARELAHGSDRVWFLAHAKHTCWPSAVVMNNALCFPQMFTLASATFAATVLRRALQIVLPDSLQSCPLHAVFPALLRRWPASIAFPAAVVMALPPTDATAWLRTAPASTSDCATGYG